MNPELIIYKKCEVQVKRQNINRKGQSRSYIYSLWQQLDFFTCVFSKKKKKKVGLGKVTDEKSVGGGIFVGKGRVSLSVRPFNIEAIAHLNKRNN